LPSGPNFNDGHGLTVDFVVVIDRFFQVRGNSSQAPPAYYLINFTDDFYAECHGLIMAKLVPTLWSKLTEATAVSVVALCEIFATKSMQLKQENSLI
jgi:hypothetical protein